MASEIQKNLVEKNEKYASTFDKGDLALPPAKKYLICEEPTVFVFTFLQPRLYIPYIYRERNQRP